MEKKGGRSGKKLKRGYEVFVVWTEKKRKKKETK